MPTITTDSPETDSSADSFKIYHLIRLVSRYWWFLPSIRGNRLYFYHNRWVGEPNIVAQLREVGSPTIISPLATYVITDPFHTLSFLDVSPITTSAATLYPALLSVSVLLLTLYFSGIRCEQNGGLPISVKCPKKPATSLSCRHI